MPRPSCTIDSSCVIALDHLNLISRLGFLFETVLVPKAVRVELSKRRATRDRLQALFEDFAFFQRCDGYEQDTVYFLLAERTREGSRDRGEVEAVVQASQFGAAVIVDDPWGRKLARNDRLEYHGTLWVLRRFHELSLLSPNELRAGLESLRRRGIRLPLESVNALLLEIGEEAV